MSPIGPAEGDLNP